MINTSIGIEKFLQRQRFKRVKPYLNGSIVDFGGNEGELKQFVNGSYTLVNYDHSPLKTLKNVDTVVALAVFEHIEMAGVYEIMQKFNNVLKNEGVVFITTPTKTAKPVLEAMAMIGLVEKENIEEHKHYWSKKELFDLAEKTGFKIVKFKYFQFGFNQEVVFRKVG